MDYIIDLLLKEKPSEYIRNNEKVFDIIPELLECRNFNQNNIWHIYDVFEHILHVVGGVSNSLVLRMAALFHDIGKPYVYKEDENGCGHFYGHWNKSNEIFLKYAKKYNLDDEITRNCSNLILYHDVNIDKLTNDELNKLINLFEKEYINMLFELKKSDLLAQNKKFHYILDNYDKQERKVLEFKKKVIM